VLGGVTGMIPRIVKKVVLDASYVIVASAVIALICYLLFLISIPKYVYTGEVWVLSVPAYSSEWFLHFYIFVLTTLLVYAVIIIAGLTFIILSVFAGSKVSEAYLKYRNWIKGLVEQE
jgi:hypothetical protein